MSDQNTCLPAVSIVIPTYNRAQFLATLLPPLLCQTYPRDRYEIILVDDGSTDGTPEQVQAFVQDWPGSFRIIQKLNGGPGSARNAGWRASEATFIAFIDSDCVAEESWLWELIDALRVSKAVGIGGPIVGVATTGWVSRYMEFTGLIRHRIRRGEVDYLSTPNAAFYRTALARIGGFDEKAGVFGAEDPDLCFRLRQDGERLAITDKAPVRHYHRQSVRSLCRTLYRYGRGNVLLSGNWKNGRTPAVEIIRHVGAVILSPAMTALRIRRIGLYWALAFWPLTVIEHTAFVVGMLHGLTTRNR